jgi:hypothetical protein
MREKRAFCVTLSDIVAVSNPLLICYASRYIGFYLSGPNLLTGGFRMGRQSALKWVQALLLLILPTIPIPADSNGSPLKFLEGSPGTVATGTGTVLDSSGNNLNGTPAGGRFTELMGWNLMV